MGVVTAYTFPWYPIAYKPSTILHHLIPRVGLDPPYVTSSFSNSIAAMSSQQDVAALQAVSDWYVPHNP